MPEVNLLPRKVFEIHGLDGYPTISGQFGTWALARYGTRCGGLTLPEVSARLSTGGSVDDILKLLLSSVEGKFLKDKVSFQYTELDAAEWIDQLGGIGGEQFTKLITHIYAGEETEKKTEESQATGLNS